MDLNLLDSGYEVEARERVLIDGTASFLLDFILYTRDDIIQGLA